MGRSGIDWHPLTTSDPVPGDPDTIENGAEYYATVRQAIADSNDSLNMILTLDDYQSDAAAALRDRATDVREHLGKVAARYEDSAEALSLYAEDLRSAQSIADGVLEDAHAEHRKYETAKDNQNYWRRMVTEATYDGDHDLARSYGIKRDNCGKDAEAALNVIQDLRDDELPRATDKRDQAAETAMAAFDDLTDDGMNDTWWDNWGAKVLGIISEVASIIAAVAGVLALVLCWVPGLGQALAAVALIAGAVALVADVILAATGEKGWGDAVMGAIGIATLGVGRVATSLFRTAILTRGVQSGTRNIRATSSTVTSVSPPSRVFINDGATTTVAMRTTVSTQSTSAVAYAKPASFSDVFSARGGTANLLWREGFQPGPIVRGALKDLKGLETLGSRQSLMTALREGKTNLSSGPWSSRFSHTFVGGREAEMLARIGVERANASSLLSNIPAAQSNMSSILGTSPLVSSGAAVVGVQALDGFQAYQGAVGQLPPVSSPGFDFSSWITGQGEMRAAPARLNL